MIAGLTIQERLQSVIKKSSMIRPDDSPAPKDIADPHGPRIQHVLRRRPNRRTVRSANPMKSMRKHRTVIPAPIRSQIVA